jgi:hypothetical protein
VVGMAVTRDGSGVLGLAQQIAGADAARCPAGPEAVIGTTSGEAAGPAQP